MISRHLFANTYRTCRLGTPDRYLDRVLVVNSLDEVFQ